MKKLFLIIAMLLFIAIASATGPPGYGQINDDVKIEQAGPDVFAIVFNDADLISPDIIMDAFLFRMISPVNAVISSNDAYFQDDARQPMKIKYKHDWQLHINYYKTNSRIPGINHSVTFRGFASSL